MAGSRAFGFGRWKSVVRVMPVLSLVVVGTSIGASLAPLCARALALAGTQPRESGASWRVVDALPSRGEMLRALAFDADLGLAVGDDAGVSWWRDGSWSRAQLPPVRDLAFGAGSRLWIGTEAGLYLWSPDARPQRRPLRDGEGSDRVSRIESQGGAVVVATESGAYWSTSGSVFQSLGSGAADQPVAWVAFRRAPSPRLTEVWTFGAEGLVRTQGIEAPAGLRVVDRRVWPLPRPAIEAGAVDLVIDATLERLYVVYPDAIAAQGIAADLDPQTSRWSWIRPVMPAGAAIRRLVLGAHETVWLVTDRGLLFASALDGPFARARNPAGSRECVEVLEAAGLPEAAQAMALCRTSLLALRDESTPSAARAKEPPPPPEISLPADPPLEEIRSRALARVGLSVERAEGLWQGLRRRAYWPSLELRGLYDVDRDRGRSRDQTFVSGDTRNLLDRDSGKGEHYGGIITFDWELGGIAYPEDSVDLSRELRQVTSLRDDVSDEIHQLYFERQRIRERLARAPGGLAPEESAELVLRAAELDSGLDAWTGGWISAWRAANAEAAAAHPIHPRRIDHSID